MRASGKVGGSGASRWGRPYAALVIPSLAYGGAERQVVLLASALRASGRPVEVITFAEGGVFRHQLEALGIPVRTFPRRPGLGVASLLRLGRHLYRTRPRIIHSFLWSANLRARVASYCAPGARKIISLRGFDDELTWLHRLAERLIDGRTDAVVANCQALQAEARQRGIGRRARQKVIYNGIDEGEASPVFPGGPDRFAIGFVGRLERKKNPLALIPVAARLARARPGSRIVVIGDGSLSAALRAAVAEADLGPMFHLAGYQAEITNWYGRMRVLVNTSISEGCCNVILEAMRAGLPVVATDVGGNRETVIDGETGILVPAGDADLMAEAVQRLLDAPAEALRMGQRAREVVAQRFSVSTMRDGYLALYDSLAPLDT